MAELPDVRPGQTWEDCDWRSRANPRRVRVLHVPDPDDFPNPQEVGILVENVKTGKRSHIRWRRFRPNSTGYRIVDAGTNGTAYDVTVTIRVASKDPHDAERTVHRAVEHALETHPLVREWTKGAPTYSFTAKVA